MLDLIPVETDIRSKSRTEKTAEGCLASPDKETIRDIFDSIAGRYDQINTLLSFSLDKGWRRKACGLILKGEERKILDLGVGTGKFLKEFLFRRNWDRAVGVDFSGEMLKTARQDLARRCELVQADIHDLPFEKDSFDLVVSSFTLRSVKDRPRFFGEIRRILKGKGRVAFLCLTRPPSWIGWLAYAPYLKFYLPLLGEFFSGNRKAYRFLSESIQTFPVPQTISRELKSSGFGRVSIVPFTFGIATLICVEK